MPLPRPLRRIYFFCCDVDRKSFLHLRVVVVVLKGEEGLAVDDAALEVVETVFAVAALVVLLMAIDVLVEVAKDEP